MKLIDNYQLEKTRKVIGSMNGKLSRKITVKLVGLRPKTYIYLTHDGSDGKT